MDIGLQSMYFCCHSVLDTESSGVKTLSGVARRLVTFF